MEHRLPWSKGRLQWGLWIISESQGSELSYFKCSNVLAGCSLLWILDTVWGAQDSSLNATEVSSSYDTVTILTLFCPEIFHFVS